MKPSALQIIQDEYLMDFMASGEIEDERAQLNFYLNVLDVKVKLVPKEMKGILPDPNDLAKLL